MEMFQIAIIVGTVIAITLGLWYVLDRFVHQKKIFIPLLFLPFIFGCGYALRFSKIDAVVDVGYFLTDMSFLSTNLVFASALLLGQKKYYRK